MLRYSSSAAILLNYTNKDCFRILYENLKTMLPIQKYIEHSRYELGSQNINMLQNSIFWAQVQNLVKNMVDGTLCDLEKLVWTSKTINMFL